MKRPGAAFTLLATIQVTLIAAITVIAVPLPAVSQPDWYLALYEA